MDRFILILNGPKAKALMLAHMTALTLVYIMYIMDKNMVHYLILTATLS